MIQKIKLNNLKNQNFNKFSISVKKFTIMHGERSVYTLNGNF